MSLPTPVPTIRNNQSLVEFVDQRGYVVGAINMSAILESVIQRFRTRESTAVVPVESEQ